MRLSYFDHATFIFIELTISICCQQRGVNLDLVNLGATHIISGTKLYCIRLEIINAIVT